MGSATVDHEQLVPSHDDEARKGSITSCTLALISTVCGGGVLSLPFAFEKLGIVASVLVLAVAAASSDFRSVVSSLYFPGCSFSLTLALHTPHTLVPSIPSSHPLRQCLPAHRIK